MTRADYTITSVSRAFQLIDLMARKNGSLSVQTLAKRLDIAPSNATRLLQTLQNAGYVEKSSKTNHYFLSNKFFVTTNRMLNSNDCVQKYMLTAYRVAEKLEAIVVLNSMQDKCSVAIFRVIGVHNRIDNMNVGGLTPAYCGSSGKAMLSQYSQEALNAFLSDLEFERYQPNTITNTAQLLHELEIIRKNGYATDREERYSGLISLSIPLNEFLQPYAFTVIMPSSRRSELFMPKTLEYIQESIHKTE